MTARQKTQVMGILNVTPDSFSDGGRFTTEKAILSQAERMITAGADIIDVGGESTRPFAAPVEAEEELRRVLPAIRLIRKRWPISLSVDTTKAGVARQAIDEGANLINDVSSLRFDPEMLEVARRTGVPVIIMHMQGTPRDMQVKPHYTDVVAEIKTFLAERLRWAGEQGLPVSQLLVDPGLGFGKTLEHNLTILRHLSELRTLGCPLVVGHSRKAFLGKVLDLEKDERDEATAVVSAWCASQGAAMLRVHDVGKTVQALRLLDAIQGTSCR